MNHPTNENKSLFQVPIFTDNVMQIFKDFPPTMDFLSIDTDFGDFWLLKTILEGGYRPRVIVVEFNRNLGKRW